MTPPSSANPGNHAWHFFRTGGLDQVAIESGADILNLDKLDPKLWVALSCPVKGLEIDEKTLALIDTDKDGRIRIPELIAAIKWAAPHLKDSGDLLKGSDSIALSALNDASPEGKSVLAAAKEILANLGLASATALSLANTTDTAKIFATTKFNGDGIITPDATADTEEKQTILDVITCLGGETDRSGAPGINTAKLDTFYAECAAFADWSARAAAATSLGEQTSTAYNAVKNIKLKIDDYFSRCRLAAFDARALTALNHQESDYLAVAAKDLSISAGEVAHFPLSRIEAARPLPLFEGVNPAWAAALATLHRDAITPMFGVGKTSLTEIEWNTLVGKLTAYEVWLASKAGAVVEKLTLTRVQTILAANRKAAIAALIEKDKAVEAAYAAISSTEKLLRLHRDLREVLHNFVNFADFYSPARPATFQAGTLYLDSRSCDLCIRVDDAGAHAALAATSKAYIAYVDCKRPGETMKIAACFTQGDSDYLFVGRNGMFIDRKGRDWDANITKIIDNPISISQAFWSPYKKVLRFIEEQVAKRAAAADSEAEGKLATAAATTANLDKAKPAEPKKLDLALITGIGVALGSIGTFFATIFAKIVEIQIWQIPLIVIGIILVISLPSMVIAALKLRQRNLGPILDANGWAINGRVKINIPFGTSLTHTAVKPAGSTTSLTDPYEDKEAAARKRRIIFLVVLISAIAGFLFCSKKFESWPWTTGVWPFQLEAKTAPAAPKAPLVEAKAAPQP